MPCFEPLDFRRHFPLLHKTVNQMPLIYFDNGATTQKPQCVLDAYQAFYGERNANVHRASHTLSALATQDFEQARVAVKAFINASQAEEIIWTKGTTEGINLIAQSWGGKYLTPGDEIVLSQSEHHANIVPWQLIASKTGAVIKVLPLSVDGRIDENKLIEVITSKTRVVACAHISNVLGRVNPLKSIIKRAKAVGAITVIDGAQAVAHLPVDVQDLDCDFYLFSAHKMFGPTGVGVLYGSFDLLSDMPPYQGGGEMIKTVSFEETTFNELPFKFEPGTPNIAGIIAFSQAIAFLKRFQGTAFTVYEHELVAYALAKLEKIPSLRFIVAGKPDIPVISFTIAGHHNHDIAAALNSQGIAVRSGHHCAMPLMNYLGLNGCLRISLAPYNTFAEVDVCVKALSDIVAEGETIFVTQNSQQDNIDETLRLTSETIIKTFAKIKAWDSRHREIMLLSKQLNRLDKAERTEQALIGGCESLAWLTFTRNNQGKYLFTADSDAKIIRGLLVIVLTAFNNKTSEQIIDFDIQDYFETLGLLQHLSPSRGNGVQAIVKKIKQLAKSV